MNLASRVELTCKRADLTLFTPMRRIGRHVRCASHVHNFRFARHPGEIQRMCKDPRRSRPLCRLLDTDLYLLTVLSGARLLHPRTAIPVYPCFHFVAEIFAVFSL